MGVVKSKLLKQISKSFPNLLKKDIEKVTNIILREIKKSLKRSERVEIRGWGSLSTRIQKSSIRRNPKTGDKIAVPTKKVIYWKMSKEMFKKIKIFVACDTTKLLKIKNIIKETQNNKLKIGYKFGLEFLNSKNGRTFLSKVKKKVIFADLKLHDIPNTCVSTIKAIKDLKVNYLTIHISSGLKALKAAKKVSGKIKLIGVTVLTSLDNKALREIGFNKNVKKIVLHQAKLANKAKLDAIVCSAQEVKIVRKIFKKEIITPGIRFTSKINDQKRVLTPREAYANGADWLVIGRDLTKGNIKKNTKSLIDHLSQ